MLTVLLFPTKHRGLSLRLLALLLAALVATPTTPALHLAPATLYSSLPSVVAADAEWILAAQLPSGAIASYTDQHYISPYLASYAALGLAEATKVTGDPRYAAAAWRYLQWYATHEDSSGVVTDYQVTNQVETTTGDEDSTDSYSGLFLLALQATQRAAPNPPLLASLHSGVSRAVSALSAVQDQDGLTWAKPTYHVKYLMDQMEARAGLRAALALSTPLHDPALASLSSSMLSRLQGGIQSLWQPSTSSYAWAKHADASLQLVNWKNLYSDSLEEVWTASFDSASKRSTTLLSTFQSYHPSWASPQATDLVMGSPAPVGYWPVAGWALLRQGDYAGAAGAASSIHSAALASSRAWPFTPGNAGELILLESLDLSLIS